MSKHKSKVTLLEHSIPAVHYSPLAYRQRQYIVAQNKKEVGWFGTGDRLDGGDFLIDRLYVPEQEVHSTETDIADRAATEFSESLLATGDCPTRFIIWGHSHVNMTPEPSGTDDDQLETYLKYADTFIRAIFNKSGEERHDIYLKDQGIVVNYAPSGVWVDPLPEEERELLDATMKLNVKAVTYVTPVTHNQYKRGAQRNNVGRVLSPAELRVKREEDEYWKAFYNGDDIMYPGGY